MYFKNLFYYIYSSSVYNTLFLVPKKNGKMRPVINLQLLNRYLVKKHFKMETMTKVIQSVKKGDWSITLDLADAYFYLKIFKHHCKYLRFSFKGEVFQVRVLSFSTQWRQEFSRRSFQ